MLNLNNTNSTIYPRPLKESCFNIAQWLVAQSTNAECERDIAKRIRKKMSVATVSDLWNMDWSNVTYLVRGANIPKIVSYELVFNFRKNDGLEAILTIHATGDMLIHHDFLVTPLITYSEEIDPTEETFYKEWLVGKVAETLTAEGN